MPVYGYRCKACENAFDLTRPMSQSGDPAQCPSCGAESKRLFTPTGVHFKGSGFHNTDYKPRAAEDTGSSAPSSTSTPDAASSTCGSCPASTAGSCPASSADSK